MAKQRKKSLFGPIVTIIFTLIFIVMIFVWEYLYRYLEAYERNVPAYEVNKITQLYTSGNFSEILRLQGVETDEFNTAEEYTEYIHDTYGDDFSDVKAFKTATDGENMIYTIYRDKTRLCTVTLSPDGKVDEFGLSGWNISVEQVQYPKIHTAKVYAPSGAQVYLNNKLLGAEQKSSEAHGIKAYEDIYDEKLRPQFDVYEVTDLLNVPEIKVCDLRGNEMNVTQKSGKYYALPVVSEEMMSIAKSRSEEIAVKYALYGITDLSFNDIAPYLFKESEYYKKVKSFYNEWYKEHTFTYDGVEFEDIIVYDDDHFSVRISFVYHINIGYKTIDYDVSYNMFFIRSEGQWLLCGMEL